MLHLKILIVYPGSIIRSKPLYLRKLPLFFLSISVFTCAIAQVNSGKESVFVHLTLGPENPTVVALAFLVAITAVEEGHTVTLFLAGDAVQVVRPGVIENHNGLRTGFLKDHIEVLNTTGCFFYLSGMSSR